MNTMNTDANKEMITMRAGEVYYGAAPLIVSTVLGPCVAVTMFSRSTGLWAACHATRPNRSLFDKAEGIDRLKFVDEAISFMLERFREFGVEKDEIEVMVFGGSSVLNPVSSTSIGTANAKRACEVLSERGLRVIFTDIGGTTVRSILFYTAIGKVVLKFHNAGTVQRQRELHLAAS